MKKRMLSLFLCFVLCLSLCPVAAWADSTEAQDGSVETTEVVTEETPEVTSEETAETASEETTEEAEETEESASEETTEEETTSEETTESADDDASDEAVSALQARIDALPDVETVSAMDEEQRNAAYMTAQDICDAFDALDEAQQALLNTAKLEALLGWFNEQVETADGEHKHCVCGESSCSSHGGVKAFAEWTAADSLPSSSGCYYLTQDVELTTPQRIKADIVLCLNGHKITMTGSSASNDSAAACVLHIFNSYELTLTDCQTTQGAITRAPEKTGLGVYVAAGGTFNLYGGTITGQTDTSKTGGGVKVEASGTFNMYGGLITNNQSVNGGGVYNLGVFNMYGGRIGSTVDGTTDDTSEEKLDGNRASKGGGVYNGGTFTMSGGTIVNNTSIGQTYKSISEGAGVFNSGTFNMAGGTIKNNVSSQGGGVTNSGDGKFTMSGRALITGNEAYGFSLNADAIRYADGGGVFNQGSFTMNGGTISKNTCYGSNYLSGGTVHGHGGGVINQGTFIMNGGTITENSMDINVGRDDLDALEVGAFGGGVYVNYGTFTMNGGTISNNEVKSHGYWSGPGAQHSHGGGVYTNYGTVNMTGGTITGNKAYYGGGVKVNSNGTLNLTGGTVSNNKSDKDGGGIYLKGTATLGGEETTVTKVFVSGNTTSADVSSGGGIDNHGTLTVKGGTKISGNTSNYGGGIANYGTLVMNSGAIVSGNTAKADGGGVYTAKQSGSTPCSATIENVTISDNKATGNGGGIRNDGTLTLTGVEVKSNTANNVGGGITNSGTLHVNSGVVISGNSANKGGGINDYGTVNLNSGAEIKNNTATVDGGGVYSSGKLNMNAGVTVSGNGATYGAGVYSTKTFNFNGGTISGNTATGNGGGIFVSGTVNMKNDATVSGNSAVNGAGLYSNGKGKANVSGGTISGNTASENGGGVYSDGTVNLSGGTIKENTANASGGGVYNKGTANLTGTNIESNTATTSGGGVYNAKTLNMSGGTIGGRSTSAANDAPKGGGVYNADCFTMTNGYIMYNTATNGAGVYDAGNSFSLAGGFSWISYNTAVEYGGGVYHEKGTLNVNGGVINSNRAMVEGGGVYYPQNADGKTHPIKLNGMVTIHGNYRGYGTASNLYLSWTGTRTLDVQVATLFGSSRIGVSTNQVLPNTYQRAVISTSAPLNTKSYFLSDNGEYKVDIEDSQLVLKTECTHKNLGKDPSDNYVCQDCGSKLAAAVTTTAADAKTTYFVNISDALSALAWDGTGILRLMSKPGGAMTLDANKTYRLEYGEGVNLLGSTIYVTAGRVTLRGAQFGNVVESKNGSYSTGEVIIDVDTSENMYLQGIKTERSGRTVFSLLKSVSGDNDCKLYGFMKKDDDNISRSTWRDHTTTVTQAYAVTVKHLPYTGLTLKKGDEVAADAETISYGDALDLTAEMTGTVETGALGVTFASNTVFCWTVNNEIMLEGKGDSAYTFYTTQPGTYTIACESSYQGYTQERSITVTVETVTVAVDTSAAAVTAKEYDGTTAATVTGLAVKATGGKVLAEGTDYTLTAAFADADAGEDKDVTVTVKLLGSGYVFDAETAAKETTVTLQGTITKKASDVQATVKRYVTSNAEAATTYKFILDALLKTVDTGSYGELTCVERVFAHNEDTDNSNNYEITVGDASRGEGDLHVLTLPVTVKYTGIDSGDKVANGQTIGTLTVLLQAKNYGGTTEDSDTITLNIELVATDKTVPNFEGDNNEPLVLQSRELTYGQKLSTLAFQDVSKYGIQASSFSWGIEGKEDSVNGDTVFPVGTHWVDWTFTPQGEAADTYAPITGTVPITVNKAVLDVTASVKEADNNKVYDGNELPATAIEGTAVNHTTSDAVTGSWSWKDEAPKAACTDKEYTVVFTPDDANYDAAETTVRVTIAQREVDITGVTAVSRIFEEGNDQVALEGGVLSTASGKPMILSLDGAPAFGANSGLIAGDMVSFSLGMGKMENDTVGDNKNVTTSIILIGRDAANYKLKQPSVRVNINAVDLSHCVVEVEQLAYTGAPQKPRVYVQGVQVDPKFIQIDNSTTATKTQPGDYQLTIITPDGRYRFGDQPTLTLDWSITKAKAVQLTDAVVAVKYGDRSEHSYSLAEKGGVPANAGKVTYTPGIAPEGVTASIDANGKLTYSVTGMDENDVGRALVVPMLIESECYEDMTVSLVITITDKEIPTLTVADVSKTYDGKSAAANGTATFDGAEIAGAWHWKHGGAYDSADETDAQPVHVLDSGVWRLVFTPDDTVTYAEVEELVNVTIEPRAVTLKSESHQKKYDGKALENGGKAVTATGMVDGEVFGYDFTGSQTAAGHSDNSFTAKDSATARVSDYAITYRFGKLTVTGSAAIGTKPAHTGDEAMPVLWLALALSAALALGYAAKKKKKN